MLRDRVAAAAICYVFALAAATGANAAVTFHFQEAAGALNGPSGVFGTVNHPVTLDFTIADPLVANHSYGFGDANIENGASGNVSEFTISAGTPQSVLKYADFTHYEYFGSNFFTIVRLNFDTDANANIGSYDLIIGGRSDGDPTKFVQYHLQDYSFDRYPPSITAGGYYIVNGGVGRTDGSLQCGFACGATLAAVTPAGDVPEPASWALMLLGFGGLGVAMRSRRRFVVV